MSSRSVKLPGWFPAALTAVIVLIVMVFAFPYTSGYKFLRQPMFNMLRNYWGGEDWQHCMLVPFAIGVIVFLRRKELALLPIAGSTIGGLSLMILSLLFYMAGYKTNVLYFGFAGVQLMAAALVVFFLGWRWMQALLFPWLFMVFMWPLIFLQDTLAFKLRIIMSMASADALNVIGIPAMCRGTAVLSAPGDMMGAQPGARFSIDVADPCSGIHSLFALMMISALYGYLVLKSWGKIAILFVSAMPLAIIGNLCRIVMLVMGTLVLGAKTALGTEDVPSTFHMASGYLVFVVALGGMIGIAWLLENGDRFIHLIKKPKRVLTAAAASKPKSPSTSEDVY